MTKFYVKPELVMTVCALLQDKLEVEKVTVRSKPGRQSELETSSGTAMEIAAVIKEATSQHDRERTREPVPGME